jgi:hypothetical protein
MLRFLLAVVVAGSALAGGIVRGVVIDPSEAHVPYATVRLLREGQAEAQYQTQTNADGEFEISDAAPGKYMVRVDHDGFRGRVKPVVVVADGARADTVRVKLGFSCDAPGANCEVIALPTNVPMPPPREPEFAHGGFYLRPGCQANLEKAAEECSGKRGDLRLERSSDGALYLRPVDRAKISDCETPKPIDQPVRVDGLGADSEWCVETNAKHHAHLFLSGPVVEPGANRVRLWVVTRKSTHIE